MFLFKLFKSCFGQLVALVEEPEWIQTQTPTIILLGSDTSGKNELFEHFTTTHHVPGPDPFLDAGSSTKVYSASPEHSQRLLYKIADAKHPVPNSGQIETIGYTNQLDSPGQPIRLFRPFFGSIQVNMINLPSEAVEDVSCLVSTKGTICYVLPLDTFDQVDPETGKSKLELELERIVWLSTIKRCNDYYSFVVLLTKFDEFQTKLNSGKRLPSVFTQGLPRGASVDETYKHMLRFISNRVHNTAKLPSVYVYPASSKERADLSMAATVRALYLTGELALAGFLSC